MTAFSSEELTGLAALGAIGSVCAVLLRSTQRNLDSLQQMREDANTVIAQLRAELRDNDDAISNLQALCADYRFHIGALRAEKRQLRQEIERLQRAIAPIPNPKS
jgi:septal ring factor EnvC (AmiA/AmiB activator)